MQFVQWRVCAQQGRRNRGRGAIATLLIFKPFAILIIFSQATIYTFSPLKGFGLLLTLPPRFSDLPTVLLSRLQYIVCPCIGIINTHSASGEIKFQEAAVVPRLCRSKNPHYGPFGQIKSTNIKPQIENCVDGIYISLGKQFWISINDLVLNLKIYSTRRQLIQNIYCATHFRP